MKDRCLFNIHTDEHHKEVLELGPCTSIKDNIIEVWKRSDGSKYLVLFGGGVYSENLIELLKEVTT